MSLAIPQNTLKRSNRWKLAGLLALLLSCAIVLLAVDNLLVSSLLAFVISYTLGPLVNYLERQGVSRTLSTAAVFLGVGVALGLLAALLAPYLGRTLSLLQADMPRYITGLGKFISEAESRVQSIAGPLSTFDLTSRVEDHLTTWTHDFFEHLPGYVRTFVTVMLLGPFLAFFMVKDGRNVVRSVMGMVPNDLFETGLSLLHQINVQIGHFVRARILEGLIVGIVTAIGLVVISFPYPLLLGVFAGVTNIIPYLGPLIGAIPALVIAMVSGYSGWGFAGVVIVYGVAQAIDAGVLIPLMVARIVNLHPVTVIVVMIAGAQIMGILGMIISIPLAGTIKVTMGTIYRHLIDTRG